jgi:cytosine/adenosine deaminase-related metal-dependent hydrolase
MALVRTRADRAHVDRRLRLASAGMALALGAAGLGSLAAGASACEKHLDGHQNGSATQSELQSERR